jgi:hypothetical protein
MCPNLNVNKEMDDAGDAERKEKKTISHCCHEYSNTVQEVLL